MTPLGRSLYINPSLRTWTPGAEQVVSAPRTLTHNVYPPSQSTLQRTYSQHEYHSSCSSSYPKCSSTMTPSCSAKTLVYPYIYSLVIVNHTPYCYSFSYTYSMQCSSKMTLSCSARMPVNMEKEGGNYSPYNDITHIIMIVLTLQ